MTTNRRTFLGLLTAVTLAPEVASAGQATAMYGSIGKLIVVPGKRDAVLAILKRSTSGMPGCLSYIVAKDAADENALWVSEAWESFAAHDASLSMPAVKNAIAQAGPLLAGFEKTAVTIPVLGVEPTAHAR